MDHVDACFMLSLGSGDSSAVRALDSHSKGLGSEPWQENFLLHCQLSVLTFTSYLFHPPVTTVAQKIRVILLDVHVAGYR